MPANQININLYYPRLILVGSGAANTIATSTYNLYGLATMLGTGTFFLPTGAGSNPGNEYTIKDVYGTCSATNTYLISAPTGYSIDGKSGYLMASPYKSISLLSFATGIWSVI